MTAQQMASPEDIERAYVRLIRKIGQPRTAAVRYDIQPPLPTSADGETDCWTHAWQVAERLDGHYVEGTCQRGKGLATHAWVEIDGPFGTTIIETTSGYEQARNYSGVRIDRTVKAVRKATWDGQRYSMLQLCIANRLDVANVILQPATTGRTP